YYVQVHPRERRHLVSSNIGDVEDAFPEPEQVDYWDATPRQGRPLFEDPPPRPPGQHDPSDHSPNLRAVPRHRTTDTPVNGRPRWESRLDAVSLNETLPKDRLARPTKGWRGAVYEMTHGKVNFGLSKAEQHRRDLINAIRRPLHTVRHV